MAILSTVTAYGLVPHMARERSKLEIRLKKIVELMLLSNYGLTDLSDAKRMNMPFELGLLLAFGKETFVSSKKPYEALRSLSDLNFGDIHYHRGTIKELVAQFSKWIEQTCAVPRISTSSLLRRCHRLQKIRSSLGPDFDKLKPHEISKLLGLVKEEFHMNLLQEER